MPRHLYVCISCRKQIERVFHHKEDVPETVPCLSCGKEVREWRPRPSETKPEEKCTEKPQYTRSPTGLIKPKVQKGRRR